MNTGFHPLFAREFGYGLCLHDAEIAEATLSHQFRSDQVDMTWQLRLHLAPGGVDNPNERDYLYTIRFLDCDGNPDLFGLVKNEIAEFGLTEGPDDRISVEVTVLPHGLSHAFTCSGIEEVSLVPAAI